MQWEAQPLRRKHVRYSNWYSFAKATTEKPIGHGLRQQLSIISYSETGGQRWWLEVRDGDVTMLAPPRGLSLVCRWVPSHVSVP